MSARGITTRATANEDQLIWLCHVRSLLINIENQVDDVTAGHIADARDRLARAAKSLKVK